MTRCSKVRKLKSKWNNHCKRSKGLIENMTGYNNNNKYKEKPKNNNWIAKRHQIRETRKKWNCK